MVWVIPVTGVSRVAEVVQRHKGPSPKSWITNMRYFVAMLRFVKIFAFPEVILCKELFLSGPSYLPYHVATCDYSINLNLISVLIVFWQNVTILLILIVLLY